MLTWKFWSAVEGATGAKARLPNLLFAAVSAAMTAFLVYNVLAGEYAVLKMCCVHKLFGFTSQPCIGIVAGGNPPKRTTEADDKALAQAAAES